MQAREQTRDDALDGSWPSQLVVTDTPDSWTGLVEQIAELEELLNELEGGDDAHDLRAVAHVRALLLAKRRSLRAIDVG
ncbi:MAG: hypothetical protein RLW61_22145 [Gammaproteobacteria bacterium]|jgi:hypothetical protein